MTGSSETLSEEAVLELRAGDLRLALRPDLGGAVAGLWLGETMVLRSTEGEALEGPRLSAGFPLVPYSNRIGYRRFNWRGKSFTTAPNFDEGPHSLHGVGWQRAWTVLASDATHALLKLHHTPDAHWPFAFDATQRFDLGPGGLRIEMSATNRSDEAAPMGLGLSLIHI